MSELTILVPVQRLMMNSLCPASPSMFTRIVDASGMCLRSRNSPPGTGAACNPWLVHRDENVYCPDACGFRPGWWLEYEEKVKEYNKPNMAFGYGARIWPEQDSALMELYKAPLQFFGIFSSFVVKGGVGCWEDMWIGLDRRAKMP